ncbi:cyclase [Plantactinospora solaniradicis]|uniref:Cyclase n=1 Tax=Plantactinospora solaniradicis TaxID=1723736 RepID=A0ABW1KK46_9ACTN
MAGRIGGWLVVMVGVGVGAAIVARRKESLPARQGDGYATVRAVTVDRPMESVREWWRDAARLSIVLDRPVAVETLDEHGRRWMVRDRSGDDGWSVEITAESEDGPFRWRIEDRPLASEGHLELTTAPGDRGTELRVELRYPGSRAGHQAAVLRGRDPDQLLRTTLRRAKSVIEAGEVVSTTDEPSGRTGPAERATKAVREKLSTGGRA